MIDVRDGSGPQDVEKQFMMFLYVPDIKKAAAIAVKAILVVL